MKRSLLALLVALAGCGDDKATADAGIDAADCGPDGCAAAGEVCGTTAVDLDAGARPCGAGLLCCYPCGVADCADRCTEPCTPGTSGCQESGCPGPFP